MPRAAALLTMVVLCALVPWPAGAQPTNDVVFVSNRSGHDEIWTTSSGDPTGSLFQVTNFGDGALREPRWSPDGQWIAFVRWMPGVSASLEAWVVRPDGTNPTQLTSFPGTSNYVFQVDFGADSDWVYFIKVFPAIRSEIWRVSITSGALEPVNLRPNTNFQSFEVSSDGRYRVEMRENGCCSTPSQHTVVHDLAQGTETTVLPNDGAAEWRPRFNSDASRFAWFQTKRDIGIWVMDRDGNNRAHLTFGNDGHATWSPDDTQLLYASGSNLHLLSLTSGITSVFLASTFQDFAPDWRDAGPTNSAPVADAGMDQVVECTVTGGMPTVTLPMGTHTITLTVMDVAGQMATDTVTITVADTTAPTVTTALTPLGNGDDHDRKGKDDDSGKDEDDDSGDKEHQFQVVAQASDACDPSPSVVADINGYPVSDGQTVVIELKNDKERVRIKHGIVEFETARATLSVVATDAAGNHASEQVVLAKSKDDDDSSDH